MIKKTLYFGNPAYLSKRNEQLLIKLPEVVKNDTLPDTFKQQSEVTIPIEDIGVMAFFDLPTETKKDRKIYTDFRKKMMKDGFTMFQFSIYLRHCPSHENADVHIKRVKTALPEKGNIGILTITDKQFGMMELFQGKTEKQVDTPYQQLELF
jgi:CRISPR-associated protein Cas2